MTNQLVNQKKWLVLVGVGLASFLGCVDFTIVNTALPAIQSALHVNIDALQWIINIFLLALCALMVIMGRLADVKGRRLLLYIGMIGFGLSSLGAGLSPNFTTLIVFRLLQGIFTAILYTAPVAIVANAFPAEERGKAIGVLFGINGMGLAIGPVLGGVIISALSWHWVFLVNVPVIIISFIICLFVVKESHSTEHGTDIDWWGLLFLTTSLTSLVLAVVQSSAWGLIPALGLLIFSIINFIVLYRVESRVKSPIIKFSLFANRLFIASVMATFALGFFYCLAFFLMPLYLNSVKGFSGYQLGLMLLPTTVVMTLLSPIVGRSTDKFGPKPIILFGLAFFILSAILQLYFGVHSTVIYIGLAFAAMGVGWAALLGPSTVATLSSVPDSMGGVASGSAWTLHNVGGVFGLALGTVVYYKAAHLVEAAHNFSLSGYHGSMWFLVIVMAVTLVAIAMIMPSYNKHKHVQVDAVGEICEEN